MFAQHISLKRADKSQILPIGMIVAISIIANSNKEFIPLGGGD